ncbi:MAG: hypothetical protein V4527_00580 [Pseudomonadota bacterium]
MDYLLPKIEHALMKEAFDESVASKGTASGIHPSQQQKAFDEMIHKKRWCTPQEMDQYLALELQLNPSLAEPAAVVKQRPAVKVDSILDPRKPSMAFIKSLEPTDQLTVANNNGIVPDDIVRKMEAKAKAKVTKPVSDAQRAANAKANLAEANLKAHEASQKK